MRAVSDPAWLDLARRTAPCRPDVRRLSEALRPVDPAQVQAALARSAGEGAWDAAQALLLGSVAAGHAPDPDLLLAVLPHLDAGWETVAALVGACAQDPPRDRVALLLRAVASRRLGIDWEVEALRLAVALLHHESRAAPPELRRALRAAARSGEVSDDLAPLLAEAVVVTGDADARQLTRPWEDGQDPQQTWLRLAREEAARPLLEALPEEPPPKLAAGYTLRRAVDKVGRNDPCPCGSGKKFKKCCEGAQAAREGDPSPVEGATLSEVLADPARWLTLEQLGALSLKELFRVDPARTTDEQLQRLIELLARSGYWERVEPLLEVLGARGGAVERPADPPEPTAPPDPPGAADPLQPALTAVVIEAEAQGASAPLVRLLDRWGERLASPLAVRARRALHAGDPGALDALEELARAGLAGEEAWEQALDLGYALLAARPALGIFVARGALDPNHPHDGDTLLGEVERARDRLLLPPGDPVWEGWDRLTGRAPLPSGRDAAASQVEDEEADLDTLRERMRALAARASELEQALERERGERRHDERRGAPTRVAAAEPEELRRLRTKVEELKALLAEGAEERRGLREELKQLQAAREEAEQERAPQGAEEREPDEAEEEGEAFPASERAPLVPVFSEASAKALRGLDPPTARLALRAVHRLAAGDPGAWSGAKRLQKVRDLASARVGIHHRLLFRPRPERSELEVVDLIHRRELEATLRRR